MFALCLRHAIQERGGSVWKLAAGIIFGLALELFSIWQYQGYSYGEFTLMILNVPLVIGVAWGNQLYAIRLYSDTTDLPARAKPVLDALLIILLDLIVDPMAIRLGFWRWRGLALDDQFFGVPFGNLLGFFCLMVAYSGTLRLVRNRESWKWRLVGPALAILSGLMTLIVTGPLIGLAPVQRLVPAVTVTTLLGASGYIILKRPQFERSANVATVSVLILSSAYYVITGLVSMTILDPPALLLVGLTVLLCSIALSTSRRNPSADGRHDLAA